MTKKLLSGSKQKSNLDKYNKFGESFEEQSFYKHEP